MVDRGRSLFLLLLIVVMSPVVITGHIKRIEDNDDAELRIRALLGIINYDWQLPIANLKEWVWTSRRK